MSQPTALIVSVRDDGDVYLGDHLIGYSGQYIKPWQAVEQVVLELADVLRERLAWPQERP